MRHTVTRWSDTRRHRPTGSAIVGSTLGALALLLAAGCNSASSPESSQSQPGSIAQNPDSGRFFIVDPNSSGQLAEVRILRTAWGRLVDVYGLDSTGERVLMNEDFVIAPSLDSDGIDYLLETSPVTAAQSLTILRDVTDTTQGGGRDQFFDALKQAEANLEPIFDKGLTGSGFFSMLPRNAVAVIQFDDLIDATTLDSTTVRTVVGTPSVIPFEARVIPDSNHGDLAEFDGEAGPEFYTSRVLVDMTVTELESFETDPPLPVNAVGLPASVDANLSNVQIRIPTKANGLLGQDMILRNPSGHGLTTVGNGSVDFSSPFLDVTRAFRSGGPTEVTTDPYNGFLRDTLPPNLVGVLNGDITSIIDDPNDSDPAVFRVTYAFDSDFCSQSPVPGDTLSQPGVFAEVIEPATVINKVVSNLRVRLIAYPSDWLNGPSTWLTTGTGPTQYLAPYDHAEDQGRAGCFLSITPQAPNPEEPTKNIESTATIRLRFSEPMDPERVNAFDAVTITREPTPAGSWDYIVGDLAHSIDLQEFQFLPDLPLAHQNGNNETYYLDLVPFDPDPDRIAGPVDLAGNEITLDFPAVELVLNSVTFESKNGGRVSFFTSPDEEAPFGDEQTGVLAEWAGQHLFDLQRGVIRPRPVVHFQGVVDRNTNPIISAMQASAIPRKAPLSNFGSKAQFLWRYMDLGMELYKLDVNTGEWVIDPSTFNVDVEGLSWAPTGGEVVVDNYSKFEIALSHTGFFPDELGAPASGLVDLFENNILSPFEDPQRIVHERFNGYSINPGDIYIVNGSLRLIPFPLNTQVDPDEYRYYTYRDTGIRARGGDNTTGVPTFYYYSVTGQTFPCLPDPNNNCSPDVCIFNPLYAPGEVQTVGLPLLMEFRCWPDDGAVGINRLDSSLAIPLLTPTTAPPWWRAHSTGGLPQNGGPAVFIDPDLETRANGGFDDTTVPPGAPTPGNDREVYMGAVDFVVRVSRSHSVWFPATNPDSPANPFTNPLYNPPTVLPAPLDQPIGTQVEFAFRGAINVSNSEASGDANSLDLYGDHYKESQSPCDGSYNHNRGTELNSGISFSTGEDSWHSNINDIIGAQYYQVRITWTSNAVTGLSPELTAFALTWTQQE